MFRAFVNSLCNGKLNVSRGWQYFLVKDILSVLVFISDPLLSHGGVSLDKHWIIRELKGNLLKHRLKATLDRI